MSGSNETTTSSLNEEAQLPTSNDSENTLDKKVRMAKKFDKEMKDYAKATVKEFLGIYGYEEDVDINMEDSAEGQSNQTDSTSQNTQSTEVTSKRLANQSPCETISSPDSGNCEQLIESDEKNQSSVITHQTSGSISFTVVSTDCCDSTTGEEPSETLLGPSASLGQPSGSLGESSGSLVESSVSVGQPSEYLVESSVSLGESSVSLGESSESLGQPSRSLRESSRSLGESSENKTKLADEEQLEEDAFVDEHSTTSGILDGTSEDNSGLSVKDKSRLRMRTKRFKETPEERAQRLLGQRDRARLRRANESDGEREFRLVKDRMRQRVKRTNEPEEVRKTRLLRQRESAQQRRSIESADQRRERLVKDRERTRTRREAERARGGSSNDS